MLMRATSRNARTLALDKPCRVCGKPIHPAYVGPVEGVCGRCNDKRRRKPVRRHHWGVVAHRPVKTRRPFALTAVLLTVVILLGSAAIIGALRMLVG